MTTPAPVGAGLAGGIGAAGGIVGKWFGSAISEATAFAAGIAIGPVLGPPVQALKNLTWAAYPDMPVSAGIAAEGVAQGHITPDAGAKWASSEGFGPTQFDAMVAAARVGPGSGYAFELWRRGEIDQAGFTTALLRLGLEQTYIDAMVNLKDTLLSSPELGMLQQQGFINQARADAEGALQGVTSERQQLRFEASGLPPGVAEGLEMLRRSIVDDATFGQIVREGHTKTKYTPQLLQLRYRVLSHLQYVEARVRGWIDNAGMYAGGALTGYTPTDLDLLHKIHGRPLSWHQVWIGIQRGGARLDPTANMTAASTGIDPDFFAALQQSDIQQQWYDLAWKQRYTYPAAFVLRALRTSGEIDDPTLRETLKFVGWEPTFIDKVAIAWTPKTGTAAKQKAQTLAHLTAEYLSGALSRAALTTALTGLGYTAQQANDEITLAEFSAAKADRTRAVRALSKRYIALQMNDAEATAALEALGLPAPAVANYLAAWTQERDDEGTTLTQKQVLTAAKKQTLSQTDALARLEVLGVSAADAAILLADA